MASELMVDDHGIVQAKSTGQGALPPYSLEKTVSVSAGDRGRLATWLSPAWLPPSLAGAHKCKGEESVVVSKPGARARPYSSPVGFSPSDPWPASLALAEGGGGVCR